MPKAAWPIIGIPHDQVSCWSAAFPPLVQRLPYCPLFWEITDSMLIGSQLFRLASWSTGVCKPSTLLPFTPPASVNVMEKSPMSASVKYWRPSVYVNYHLFPEWVGRCSYLTTNVADVPRIRAKFIPLCICFLTLQINGAVWPTERFHKHRAFSRDVRILPRNIISHLLHRDQR